MACGLGEQIEKEMDYMLDSKRGVVQHSHKLDKRQKNRTERRRAKRDVECQPLYRKFKGWEW